MLSGIIYRVIATILQAFTKDSFFKRISKEDRLYCVMLIAPEALWHHTDFMNVLFAKKSANFLVVFFFFF